MMSVPFQVPPIIKRKQRQTDAVAFDVMRNTVNNRWYHCSEEHLPTTELAGDVEDIESVVCLSLACHAWSRRQINQGAGDVPASEAANEPAQKEKRGKSIRIIKIMIERRNALREA